MLNAVPQLGHGGGVRCSHEVLADLYLGMWARLQKQGIFIQAKDLLKPLILS